MDHKMFPLEFNGNTKKPILIPITINNSDIMKKLFSFDMNSDLNSLPLSIGNKPASMKCRKISTLGNPFDMNIRKPSMEMGNPFSSCKKNISTLGNPFDINTREPKIDNPFSSCKKKDFSIQNENLDSRLDKMLSNSILQEKQSSKLNLSNISFNIQYETIIIFFVSFLILFYMSTRISFLRYVDENNNYRPNIFRVILLSFLISVFFLMQSSIFLLEKITN